MLQLKNERPSDVFGFPYLKHRINIPDLIKLAKTESIQSRPLNTGGTLFIMHDDTTSNITRAIQENAILHTKITVKGRVLNSFWEAWRKSKTLQRTIFRSSDPLEEMWIQSRANGYKLATTFMPSYAKAIYEHFNATIVLDPCAGWGDRLLGALTSSCVEKYIGFDPNKKLRPGYADIIAAVRHIHPSSINEHVMSFDNIVSIYSTPFEMGISNIPDETVDLVFTSPPFFDYEIYCSTNPMYTDWISEFYVPLFRESERVCKQSGHVVIYVDDTSSGGINQFIQTHIQHICPLLVLQPKIAFMGITSKKQRNIWVLKKL
jgi:hypothetical protein